MILELLATDTAMMGALLSIKKHRLQAVRRKELLLGARGTQPVKSIPILEYQMKRSSKASTSELKVGRMIANLIRTLVGYQAFDVLAANVVHNLLKGRQDPKLKAGISMLEQYLNRK
jgi:hypothetical protein